jgi:inosine-uridine nucleoside N-ribohydrolase
MNNVKYQMYEFASVTAPTNGANGNSPVISPAFLHLAFTWLYKPSHVETAEFAVQVERPSDCFTGQTVLPDDGVSEGPDSISVMTNEAQAPS